MYVVSIFHACETYTRRDEQARVSALIYRSSSDDNSRRLAARQLFLDVSCKLIPIAYNLVFLRLGNFLVVSGDSYVQRQLYQTESSCMCLELHVLTTNNLRLSLNISLIFVSDAGYSDAPSPLY
jgi:hypothetical protein